jgi:hypothetical protein
MQAGGSVAVTVPAGGADEVSGMLTELALGQYRQRFEDEGYTSLQDICNAGLEDLVNDVCVKKPHAGRILTGAKERTAAGKLLAATSASADEVLVQLAKTPIVLGGDLALAQEETSHASGDEGAIATEDAWLFDKAKVDVNDCCLFYGHKKEEQVSAGNGTLLPKPTERC